MSLSYQVVIFCNFNKYRRDRILIVENKYYEYSLPLEIVGKSV